ncbi:MAG: glycosyltransferase family 39 protein [Saprospiraceae bacterium]|nr:glycosyltransferase family 39 protein [Saprospiraceae bacterium]
MFKTYFDNTQLLCLVFGLFALLFSIICHIQKRDRWALVGLALAAFGVFSFGALLDPFINLWDERFHALVAKSMTENPIKPMLYADPVIDIDYNRWDRYHIWLHKQPLFLWQIALCFKLFGIHEYVLRLPNVLMGMGLILIAYRCAKLLVNREVAFLTSILVLSSSYYISLISGRQILEHNDFSFTFYISASIWAWIEYQISGKKKWVYWIGIFAGGAILCKWLVGLLVYFGWGIYKLQAKQFHPKYYLDMIRALVITLLIALPWQIYGFWRFPEVAKMVYAHNLLHFSTALDGHRGDIWYHLDHIHRLYGRFATLLIVPSFMILYREIKHKKLFFPLVSMILVVYIFFSMAKTKMPSFTIVVSVIIFIAFATLFYRLLEELKNKLAKPKMFSAFLAVFLMVWVIWELNLEGLQKQHTTWKSDNHYTYRLSHNRELFKRLELPEQTVIFNVYGRHYVECMFYSPYTAYNHIPTEQQYQHLKKLKRPIAVLGPLPTEIPAYLQNDAEVIWLKEELQAIDID